MNRVRKKRKAAWLTQEELAKKSGVSRVAISNIETGKYVPRVDTALMLADALRCKVEDLFSLGEER